MRLSVVSACKEHMLWHQHMYAYMLWHQHMHAYIRQQQTTHCSITHLFKMGPNIMISDVLCIAAPLRCWVQNMSRIQNYF